MPEITLEVLSLDSAPLPERQCLFTGVGGTIGRDEGNTLVLQDKHRRVSRLHASITFPEGVATITNASTSLPVTVGSAVLAYGQKVPLSAADLIEIGPFILRVRAPASDSVEDALLAHSQPTILAAVSKPPQAEKPQIIPVESINPDMDPFAGLFADVAPAVPQSGCRSQPVLGPNVFQSSPVSAPVSVESDPFADLLGLGMPPVGSASSSGATGGGDPFAAYSQRTEPTPTGAGSYRLEPMAQRSPAAIIPEDFNPFELPSQTARNSADPLAQMLGEATQNASVIGNSEPSIDALFSPSVSSPFNGLTGEAFPDASYPAQGLNSLSLPPENNDPLMLFGESGTRAGMQARTPMRDDLPEVAGAFQPPRAFISGGFTPFQEQQNSRTTNPASSNAVAGTSPDALTLAFLKGTGLPANALPGGLTPEIMTVIGSLLKTATAGAIDMLAARAATKLEVQACVTIISAQSNNPLKFLPNAESALQQMLGKRMPGFMRADEAMRDAFDDLRAHEIGVIAGTRAALTEVLERFDPSVLEKRLARGSLIDSLLPSIRKTKLWEIYLEQYAKIRREAEDDFQSVFGRSFLAAYEQETARVKVQTTEAGNNQ